MAPTSGSAATDEPGGDGGLARSTLRGTAWTGASHLSGKFLFFLSTVILARVLDPGDFGVAAYAITLIAMVSAVPSLGLGPALIYYRDDDRMLSTGFWLGLLAGVAGFAAVWWLAPWSEHLFGDPRAVSVTRGLALVFPIEALRNVHAALMRKRLAFRRRFVPELVQSVAKGGISIALALAGFGYWSLIWGTIGGAIAGVPAYWYAARWHPGLRFDGGAARQLLPFGGHVVFVDAVGAFVRNLDYLLVGRFLGAVSLGVYTLAFRIPDLLIRNLARILGQVLLPVYAKVKDDPVQVRETFLATTTYAFALTAPMAIGLAIVAEPLVRVAFSEKWMGAVPVVVPICVYALIGSLTFNLGDLFKGLGRPEVLTRLSLLRAAIAVPALGYAAAGVGTAAAVGWAQAGVAAVALVANAWVAQFTFRLPVRAALAQLTPVVAACTAMAAVTAVVEVASEGQPALLRLLVCTVSGALVYVAALRILAPDFFAAGLSGLRDAMPRGSRVGVPR